jgi:hypothetical protein
MRYVVISTLQIFVLAVCLSFISSNSNYAAAGESLDGKTFSIEVTEKDKSESTNDELVFKEGTFFSTDCEQYGFGSAPYESKSKGDTTMFKSTLTSDKEGKAEWEGKVQGDDIAGTFIWSKAGQDQIIYTYKGSLKK